MKTLQKELTPRDVVAYLDRYIVGQNGAKRAVAIALRNRIRRKMLPEEIAREIAPKNILMMGPTGVGKTEIARRLARLVDAPFVKVEATKFTEVGYVGRDVESLVRDLVEAAVQMVRQRKIEEVQEPARERAEERLLDILLPRPKKEGHIPDFAKMFGLSQNTETEMENKNDVDDDIRPQETAEEERSTHTREKLREMLHAGKLDEREVDIEVDESPRMGMSIIGGMGMEEMGINIGELLGGMMPKKQNKKRMTVVDALAVLQADEAEKLIDREAIHREAVKKTQEEGIVFLDEIDKIASGSGTSGNLDVSREGVQRDLLPIVEGCAVQTKYGTVHTDHILFIAAGAFHKSKPSDLVPELQGRLPIRVELQPLSEEDLVRILTEPENSLVNQYQALIGTEGVEIDFTEEGVAAMASIAAMMNVQMENIGARRLHAMMEHLLEEISFDAPDHAGSVISLDGSFVREKLSSLAQNEDARKYLL